MWIRMTVYVFAYKLISVAHCCLVFVVVVEISLLFVLLFITTIL